MELYSNNDYRYYLFHHQRKGAKWGVRHGPPYPLDKEGKAKFEADVKERKQKERMSGGVGSSYLSAHDSEWQEMEVRYFQDGSIGYFPAAKVIKDFENDGAGNPYPKYDDRYGSSGDCGKTNPDYPQDGCTNNCTKCTSAMELRKRGYDVRAGRMSNGAKPDVFEYWWDGAEKYEFDNASTDENRNKITETLTNFGAGASGSITLTYGDGSNGHAIYWTTDGAQVYFYDGQNDNSITYSRTGDQLGKVYDTYRFNPENSVLVYRLDQATPNWDHMAEDSVIRPPASSGSKVKNKNSGRVVDRW